MNSALLQIIKAWIKDQTFLGTVKEINDLGSAVAVDFLTLNQHLVRLECGLEYLIDFDSKLILEV